MGGVLPKAKFLGKKIKVALLRPVHFKAEEDNIADQKKRWHNKQGDFSAEALKYKERRRKVAKKGDRRRQNPLVKKTRGS